MKGILDKNDEIKKAHIEYKKFTADDRMRELYEARLKHQRDMDSLLHHTRIDEKKETAKKMKEKGLDINLISEITGLAFEEIQKL